MAELRKSLDPGRDGTNALDLRDEARSRGLKCSGRRVDEIEVLARLPMPLLAHWEGDHYVVVTAARTDRVDVMDPAIGRRRLSHADFLAGATGLVLAFGQTAQDKPRGTGQRPTSAVVRSIVRPALRDNRGALTLIGLLALLLLLLGLVVPWLTAQVVDGFVAGPAMAATERDPVIAVVVGLFAEIAILTLARGQATALVQRRVGQRLTDTLFRRLVGAPLQFIEERGPGDLSARVLSTDGLRDAVANRLVGALLDAATGLVYLSVVMAAAPEIGLITGALALVQLIVLGALALRGRRLRREELLAQARFSSWLFEVAQAIPWVKGAGAEDIVERRASLLRARQLTALHQASRNDAVAQATASAIRTTTLLLLLVAATATPSAGSVGQVVAIAGLAAAAVVPLGNIATNLRDLYQIGSILDHLEDLADAPAESRDDQPQIGHLQGAITAKDLSFRFTRHGPWIVNDLSLTVPPGAKIAIVGPSGSGKSTLAKLIVGLYEPTAGLILIDGLNLRSLQPRSVRRLLGVVWQDPLLFSGTIHDNITLRVPDAPPADVHEAARLAGIEPDIAAMPMKYETILGPAGEGLSGGQRQRLALARALLGRPAILVLDEATSHLDTPTEALVEHNLRAIGVTRIVIAHRLSTVQDADMIIVMAAGRIIEQGTHQDLLELDGEYARMVLAQQGSARMMIATRPPPAKGRQATRSRL
jgi:ABC-type bacteriocin/lantibiotic exporter with double-glycine peptidase domain